jgi:toxin FitB
MNVVDSSGWLEWFTDGQNADVFADPIVQIDQLIVPTICLYEVFKVVLRQRGEGDALNAIAVMRQGQVADLDGEIALSAARLSATLGLPMADSIILATTRAFAATLWTQDSDFREIPDVQYVPKTQ